MHQDASLKGRGARRCALKDSGKASFRLPKLQDLKKTLPCIHRQRTDGPNPAQWGSEHCRREASEARGQLLDKL